MDDDELKQKIAARREEYERAAQEAQQKSAAGALDEPDQGAEFLRGLAQSAVIRRLSK